MQQARASILSKCRSPLQVQNLPLPSRVEPGAVLVRTEMAGICGTDVHLWKGEFPIALRSSSAMRPSGESNSSEKDWNATGPANRSRPVTASPGIQALPAANVFTAPKSASRPAVPGVAHMESAIVAINRRTFSAAMPNSITCRHTIDLGSVPDPAARLGCGTGTHRRLRGRCSPGMRRDGGKGRELSCSPSMRN